jgi:hypothetical protein
MLINASAAVRSFIIHPTVSIMMDFLPIDSIGG